MARVFNFNAGPAGLPLAALERAQGEFIDFEGTGMSILEHSHRGKAYDAVHNQAIALLRELLDVPEDYHVLFLQGGASQQFAVIPMNLLADGKSADYIVTGAWGKKAFAEAQIVGKARLAGSTAEDKFVRLPAQSELDLDPNAAYLHFTSNETIHGVQYDTFPESSAPLVCDMSSDFLWRKIDVRKFGLIYAGAQKNIGPSGVVCVIVRKDLVEASRKDIPKIFQYRTHAEANSLANTSPTFAIYMVRNVLQLLKDKGGLDQIEKTNREKARLVYAFLDGHSDYFKAPVRAENRSVMNIVFRLPTPELEAKLVADAAAAGFVGLKGHRSVGGIRISAYNAVTLEAIQKLLAYLDDFAAKNRA